MKECIKKNRVLLIFIIIFSIISSVTMVGVSLLLQSTIDRVTDGDMEGFKRVLIFTMVYCLIMAMLYFIYDILSKIFIKNVTQELRSKIFKGIMNHNYKDFTSISFIQPIIMIMSCVPKISSMKTVIKRLDDISNYQDESFLGSEIPTFENCLEISNLNFAYEENKSILNNIDLKINKNKKYVIVGASGCGKSTLVKLILGYYADYNG